MYQLRRSLVYMLILTVIGAGFTMVIVIKAFSNVDTVYAQYE